MRTVSRFIGPLALLLAAFALISVFAVDKLMIRWFAYDLTVRGGLIEDALESAVEKSLKTGEFSDLHLRFNRVSTDERLFGLGLCNDAGHLLVGSDKFAPAAYCVPPPTEKSTSIRETESGLFHLQVLPLKSEDGKGYALVLVHDMSFVNDRSTELRVGIFVFFLVLGVILAVSTLVLFRFAFSEWVTHVRALIRNEGGHSVEVPSIPRELLPVLKEFRTVMRQMEDGRRFSDEARELWTPKKLRDLLNTRLKGEKVLILANREPYIHVRVEGKVEVQLPASGMVTALEPIMRACSGIWIAHGSGDADREVVDNHDRVSVPPENPAYQLRRVWLSPEEEQGYYFGFSNEGIWPLCHIAHMRPIFRKEDWEIYKAVNRRFADAVVEEACCDDPIVLVQDYHFALAPRMIREKLPRATIITFWHIPWPNSEKFGICPWQSELLDGLLGSTIVGFHTRTHVNNFMDTVDRAIESRIDREDFSISLRGHLSAVRSYPISIEFPPEKLVAVPTAAESKRIVLGRHRLPEGTAIGVGVERLDYTKGILERFWSIERLLESRVEFRGKLTFIQIAAPSRWRIPAYSKFADEVRALGDSINAKYSVDGVPPIILLEKHHDASSVYEYYRAADFCMVSSLHDGMNLVAKEFAASRDDELGVLILSIFAGASRELPEALIVNPYDTEQCASAIAQALSMTREEQQQRMRSMREQVREWNVFRWAARMILDAAEVREKERFMRVVGGVNAKSDKSLGSTLDAL